MHTGFCRSITVSLVTEPSSFVSPDRRWHHFPTTVLAAWQICRILVIYRGDWLSIKFCENDSFRKLFLFFENTFQYLGRISQDISVSHFDSRRSLSSSNWRRSSSPILFVSFTQPCDQHDRKIRMIRKSAAWWRGLGVVREAIGNYFCVQICCMFPVSKCRGDWDLVLCTTSVLAFGEQMRDGKIRKKRVSTKKKSDFAIALRFSKRKYRSCAQT